MDTYESITNEELAELFRSFQRTAFRLETLQTYSVDAEKVALNDFRAGKPRYELAHRAKWTQMLRESSAAGKEIARVHLVVEPLSDYLNYELSWPYAEGVEAGENIRIMPVVANNWPSDIPREDFWLFDRTHVAVMRYDAIGHFLKAETTRESALISQFSQRQSIALASSVPYDEYVNGLRQRNGYSSPNS